MQITLESSRLAAVLCLDGDHSLEPLPQPFRLQDALTVVVPYHAYTEFLRTSPEYSKYLYSAVDKPVRSYYMNIARAVAKECYFAIQNKTRPTHIRHKLPDTPAVQPPVSRKDFNDAFSAYMDKEGFGFAITPLIQSEWDYALDLCACSRSEKPIFWNPNLEGGM